MIYSANMLKTYKVCPQKYKLKYVDKFVLPQNFEIFEKGKKIHALAYYYLKGDDISAFQNALNVEEMALWEILRTNEFFNKKTYRAEFDLNFRMGEFWIGGRIDAVVYEGKNYYILDYKTGSAPENPQEDLQTLVYLEALAQHLKGDFEELKFVYIDLKNNCNVVVNYNLVHSEIIEHICRQIASEKFSPISECKGCEYTKICKVAS